MSTDAIQEAKALIAKAGMNAVAVLAKIGWAYTIVDAEGVEHTNQTKKTTRRKLNSFKHHNIRARLVEAQIGEVLLFEAAEGEDVASLQATVCGSAAKIHGKGSYQTTQSQSPRGILIQITGQTGDLLDDALRTLGGANV